MWSNNNIGAHGLGEGEVCLWGGTRRGEVQGYDCKLPQPTITAATADPTRTTQPNRHNCRPNPQENAILTHHKSGADDFKLHIPRFEVKPGEVAAIIGRVGSGKSSVFTAVLDNMRVEGGNVAVGGRIAYVPQSPWVQNLSLRDNIL